MSDENVSPNGDAAPKRGRHYDWVAIKAQYVEGVDVDGVLTWPTLDECARANGATPAKVRERAGRERWGEERATFQRRVEVERQEQRSGELARLGADLDLAALRIARTGLAMTASRLSELGQRAQDRQRYLERARDSEGALSIHDAPPAASAREVRELATSASVWYRLGSEALGDVHTTGVLVGSSPSRPIRVEMEMSDEDRTARTEGIVAILVEAGVIDGADPGMGELTQRRPALDARSPDDAEAD